MRRLLLVSLLLLATHSALAEWQVVEATSEASAAGQVIHHHVSLEQPATGQRAVVDLAIFPDESCTLRVIQNENGASTLAEAMPREKCLVGVNGGYFNSEFEPIGLRISNGKTIAPLKQAKLLTGVLVASPHQIRILRTREYSGEKIESAIQCGPFLVDLGRRVRGLDNSRPARRTFVATANGHHAAIGVGSEVSLAELAEILATPGLAKDFKIQRALNLDGGSSTAFWFARHSGNAFSILEQKTVRDFVGIVLK